MTILQEALIQQAVSPHLIQFVDDTSRETAQQLMRLNDYLMSSFRVAAPT